MKVHAHVMTHDFVAEYPSRDLQQHRRSPQVQAFSTGGKKEETATHSNSRSAEILLSSSRNTSVEKDREKHFTSFWQLHRQVEDDQIDDVFNADRMRGERTPFQDPLK